MYGESALIGNSITFILINLFRKLKKLRIEISNFKKINIMKKTQNVCAIIIIYCLQMSLNYLFFVQFFEV